MSGLWGVLDTPVRVSGVACPVSVPGRIVAAWRQGEGVCIHWSLSLTPVRELLGLRLRLRLREELTIAEDDHDSKGWRETVATGRCAEVLFGQVIQGVLDELCFHGGPHPLHDCGRAPCIPW